MVSANNDPITKAPNAEENPALAAIITIPKQKPNAMINKVSVVKKWLNLFKKTWNQIDSE